MATKLNYEQWLKAQRKTMDVDSMPTKTLKWLYKVYTQHG